MCHCAKKKANVAQILCMKMNENDLSDFFEVPQRVPCVPINDDDDEDMKKRHRVMDAMFTPMYSGNYISQTRSMIGVFECDRAYRAYTLLNVLLPPELREAHSNRFHVTFVATVEVEKGSCLVKSHDVNRFSGLSYTMRVDRARLLDVFVPSKVDAEFSALCSEVLKIVKPGTVATFCADGTHSLLFANPDSVLTTDNSNHLHLTPMEGVFSFDVASVLGSGVFVWPNVSECVKVIEAINTVGLEAFSARWMSARTAGFHNRLHFLKQQRQSPNAENPKGDRSSTTTCHAQNN